MPPSNDYVMFVVVNFIHPGDEGAVYLPPPITGCMLGEEYRSLEMVKIGGVKIDAYLVAARVTHNQFNMKFQNKMTFSNLMIAINRIADARK